MKHHKSNGFTLIELLVTMVIIVILVSVAIPSYKAYIVRNAESEAQQLLLQIKGDTEKWKAKRLSYKGFNKEYETSGGKYSIIIRDGVDTSKKLNAVCAASAPSCINPVAGSWVAFAEPVGFKGYKYRINNNGEKCKMYKTELAYDSFNISNDCTTGGTEKW